MQLADDDRPRLSPHVRLVFNEVREEHALLSPETVWVINPTGAAIVERCNGERTVAEITADLRAAYDGLESSDVVEFVTALVAQHSMEVHRG